MTVLLVLYCLIVTHNGLYATDMSHNSFGLYREGIIAAFGDFNSDELTDAFVINNKTNLQVFLAHDKEPLLRPSQYACNFTNFNEITSIVPGDYDGDAYMDILISTTNDYHIHDIRILWGGVAVLNCSHADVIKASIIGQPLVLDYDHNMILDLFGLNSHNERVFWVFNKERTLPTEIPLSDDFSKELKVPHSHSFLDVNHDNAADLLLTTIFDVEIWLSNAEEGFTYLDIIPLPIGREYVIFGQVMFLDVALSGEFFLVLPVCFDAKCINSSILIYDNNVWHNLQLDFNDGKGNIWRFIPPKNESYLDTITMRSGDFNMDGYPDILMTLSPETSNETRVFLFHNVKCGFPECKFHRTFEIQWDKFNSFGNDAVMSTFYDFYMDGVLDIIYVTKNVTSNKYIMSAFRNELEYDTNFIKVIVVTGLTNPVMPIRNNSFSTRKPTFGTNLPGPKIGYYTWSQEGTYRIGVCAQLSQSAHFSLQLPYSIFGLDRSPNFVDTLNVGVSGYSKSWNQIIPNLQIVVIPSPPDEPSQWKAQLFLSPSKLILKSVLGLTGIVIFISSVILYLHWKEKNEPEDGVETSDTSYDKL